MIMPLRPTPRPTLMAIVLLSDVPPDVPPPSSFPDPPPPFPVPQEPSSQETGKLIVVVSIWLQL